jgi:hypothetical protein
LVEKEAIPRFTGTAAMAVRQMVDAFFGHPKSTNALCALLLAAITRMHEGIPQGH